MWGERRGTRRERAEKGARCSRTKGQRTKMAVLYRKSRPSPRLGSSGEGEGHGSQEGPVTGRDQGFKENQVAVVRFNMLNRHLRHLSQV